MKPTFITEEVLVVELPEGAQEICLPSDTELSYIVPHDNNYELGSLPPGYTYSLIGTEISEKQAKGFVKRTTQYFVCDWYHNYETKQFTCLTALESLRSLELSKGIAATNKVYLKAEKI